MGGKVSNTSDFSNIVQSSQLVSLQPNIDRASRTKLDSEVKTTWLDSFELGQGIDALNSCSRRSPFKDIESLKVVPDSDPPHLEYDSNVVHGQHEVSNKRRHYAEGTINTHSPLTIMTSFARERTSSDSKTSLMIEQFVNGYYNFEKLKTDSLQLTDEAKSLLRQSPDKFRDEYGDYFIIGYQRHFMFSALIGCK